MKKIISVFLSFLMLTASAFAAEPIYTKTSKSTVTGSVSRRQIQKFYGDYALNINLITADLSDKNLSFSLLKHSGGSDKVDTVMNLASKEENVVAAINADFFSAYKGDQNFSLGLEIQNGELLQSHINSDMAAGFFEDGALSFSYLDFKGTVTAPNGASSPLSHINKPTDYYGSVLMYTPAFNGGTSPFLPSGITAVTVVEDVVTAKGVSLGGTIPIPENGYILVIDDRMTPFLEYNFNIGEEVKIELSEAKLIDGVETSFGGGTLLVKDGKKTPVTHDVSGNHPRTAIGTNDDGSVIYFLTVDGRQTVSRGVSLSELQDICLEMGMKNAMNLDGGGSTAMVAKSLSNPSLHYINSPSEKRKVINAVAITSSAKPGKTAGFIIAPESSNVLVGDSVKLYLTPYDENYNKPIDNPTNYTWKIKSGKGNVKNNVYYAEAVGKTVIELYFNGKVTDTCEINVTDEVCEVNVSGTNNVTNDDMYKDATGGFSFNVMASTPSETLLDKLIYKKGMEIFTKADASAVVGGEYIEEHTPESVSPQRAQSFTENNYQNAKIVSVDLSDKGVFSRGSQWKKLDSALKGGLQKNVIVLLDSAPTFVADLDKLAFENMLQTAAKTKNVFVVYCGDENSATMKNGVRYISVSDSKDGDDVKSTVETMKYLSFNITNDGITYFFKNMYEIETDDNSRIVLD